MIELARVVDRGIRESGTVDMSKLVIKKDVSVVGVFADNSVVDHDGNLFDACSYASTCAILSSKMPKWEMVDDRPKIVEGAEGHQHQFNHGPIRCLQTICKWRAI